MLLTPSQATLETFPILSNADFTISIVSLGPCGLFVPHVHPRANEFFLVIDGEVDFGYMLELGLLKNGAPNPEIPGKLTKNVGTFFPQGSIHYQNNPTCDPMTAVVILDNKDPGSTPIVGAGPATGNGTVVPRQTGGRDFEMFRPLLPAFIVSEVDKCFARCGM
jgi:mannose-6-phosphate isomerase-like protein (cupin superfamily)